MMKYLKYIKRVILRLLIISIVLLTKVMAKIIINDRFINNCPDGDQEYLLG